MERLGLFLSAVISGLSLPVTTLSARESRVSDTERLRGDWMAVGNTMRHTMSNQISQPARHDNHAARQKTARRTHTSQG